MILVLGSCLWEAAKHAKRNTKSKKIRNQAKKDLQRAIRFGVVTGSSFLRDRVIHDDWIRFRLASGCFAEARVHFLHFSFLLAFYYFVTRCFFVRPLRTLLSKGRCEGIRVITLALLRNQ